VSPSERAHVFQRPARRPRRVRRFAPALFPEAREHDEYDRDLIHFAAKQGDEIAGTLRLVSDSRPGFPLDRFRNARWPSTRDLPRVESAEISPWSSDLAIGGCWTRAGARDLRSAARAWAGRRIDATTVDPLWRCARAVPGDVSREAPAAQALQLRLRAGEAIESCGRMLERLEPNVSQRNAAFVAYSS
jgi:hypothetical protein